MVKRIILNIDLVSSMKNHANSGLSLNDSLPTKSAYRLLAFCFGCFIMIDKLIKLIEESRAGCWCNVFNCSENEYCCDCPLYSDKKDAILSELKELQEIKKDMKDFYDKESDGK